MQQIKICIKLKEQAKIKLCKNLQSKICHIMIKLILYYNLQCDKILSVYIRHTYMPPQRLALLLKLVILS